MRLVILFFIVFTGYSLSGQSTLRPMDQTIQMRATQEYNDRLYKASNDRMLSKNPYESIDGSPYFLEEPQDAILTLVNDEIVELKILIDRYADELISHPLGGVALEGFSVYRSYFAEALENLSVTMHIFRAGEDKNAVEPFLRSDMSENEKAVNQQWLDQLWGVYTTTVEANRDLPAGALNDYANGFASRLQSSNGDSAQLALDSPPTTELQAVLSWYLFTTSALSETPCVPDRDGVPRLPSEVFWLDPTIACLLDVEPFAAVL